MTNLVMNNVVLSWKWSHLLPLPMTSVIIHQSRRKRERSALHVTHLHERVNSALSKFINPMMVFLLLQFVVFISQKELAESQVLPMTLYEAGYITKNRSEKQKVTDRMGA
jgi:hypothetical protein